METSVSSPQASPTNPRQPTTSTKSPNTSTIQRLPNELFYYMAMEFTPKLGDIARLGKTCRALAGLVRPLLYRRDVMDIMALEHAGAKLRPNPDPNNNEDANDGPYTARWKAHLRRPYYHPHDVPPIRTQPRIVSSLHWAARRGNVSVAKAAIKAALEIAPEYLDTKDIFCLTPLAAAAYRGHVEVMRELIEAGCFIDAPISGYVFSFSRHSFTMTSFIEETCSITPIVLAIHRKSEAAASLLTQFTKHPGEAYDIPRFVYPSLHMAAAMGMPRIVKLLLDSGCSVEHTMPNWPGCKPLHTAVTRDQNYEVIEILIAHGASLDAVTWSGTPLMVAINHNCYHNALHLIRKRDGIGKWAIDALRGTAFSDRGLEATIELVKRFNAHGAFEAINDSVGPHMLYNRATEETSKFLVNFLIRDLNRSYLQEGQTYLHWALSRPQVNEFALEYVLREAGDSLDINVKDAEGCTPLDHAEYNGHMNIARYLEECYGATRGDDILGARSDYIKGLFDTIED